MIVAEGGPLRFRFAPLGSETLMLATLKSAPSIDRNTRKDAGRGWSSWRCCRPRIIPILYMSSVHGQWFDKLTTNGEKAFRPPFDLSQSKGAFATFPNKVGINPSCREELGTSLPTAAGSS